MEEMKGNYDERARRRGARYPLFGFVVTILVLLSSMSMISESSQCAQPYMVRGDNITITNPTEGAVILHNSTVTITWEYTGEIARRIGSAEVNFTVDAEPPEMYMQEPWKNEIIWQSTVYVEWYYPTPQARTYDGMPIDHADVKLDNISVDREIKEKNSK